jgi:hypothetical protein
MLCLGILAKILSILAKIEKIIAKIFRDRAFAAIGLECEGIAYTVRKTRLGAYRLMGEASYGNENSCRPARGQDSAAA